ncbi:hypothetical protein [Flavobacterium sp.]|uniref:hypothetical protein n=1 Tax=Flavobacterium sp. TaxID=239 RepID=UPI003BA8CDD5
MVHVNMEARHFKSLILVSFLAILTPGAHVSLPNAILLPLLLLQSAWQLFTTLVSSAIIFDFAVALVLCCSLVLMLLRNKLLTLVAIVIQISWLAYTFQIKYLEYWYYTIPATTYCLLTLFLLIKTIRILLKGSASDVSS